MEKHRSVVPSASTTAVAVLPDATSTGPVDGESSVVYDPLGEARYDNEDLETGEDEYDMCGDYELRDGEGEESTRPVLTKPCPRCKRRVEKSSETSCQLLDNSMMCLVCHTSFCWLCDKVIENVEEHYDPEREGDCRGLQYYDPDDCRRSGDYWTDEKALLGVLRESMRFETNYAMWGVGFITGLAVTVTLALLSALIITPFAMCRLRELRVFGRIYNEAYGRLETVCLRVFGSVDTLIFIAMVLTGFFLYVIIHAIAHFLKLVCRW